MLGSIAAWRWLTSPLSQPHTSASSPATTATTTTTTTTAAANSIDPICCHSPTPIGDFIIEENDTYLKTRLLLDNENHILHNYALRNFAFIRLLNYSAHVLTPLAVCLPVVIMFHTLGSVAWWACLWLLNWCISFAFAVFLFRYQKTQVSAKFTIEALIYCGVYALNSFAIIIGEHYLGSSDYSSCYNLGFLFVLFCTSTLLFAVFVLRFLISNFSTKFSSREKKNRPSLPSWRLSRPNWGQRVLKYLEWPFLQLTNYVNRGLTAPLNRGYLNDRRSWFILSLIFATIFLVCSCYTTFTRFFFSSLLPFSSLSFIFIFSLFFFSFHILLYMYIFIYHSLFLAKILHTFF